MRGFQYPLQNNIGLPPGSKDLVALTLLGKNLTDFAREWDSVSGWMPAGAQPEGIDHGASWRIEKHLSSLLSAQQKPSFLAIQVGAYPLQLFCETEAGPLELLLAFPENDSERERTIHGFFSDRCINQVPDHPPGRLGWRVFRYALPRLQRCLSSGAPGTGAPGTSVGMWPCV